MRCIQCRSDMGPGQLETVPYQAAPDIDIEGVTVYRCASCDKTYTAFPDLTGIEDRAALAIARRPGRLAPREVRFLRRWMDWSSKHFAELLSVDPSTVSRWEHGTSEMAPQTEKLLRLVVASRCHAVELKADLEGLLKLDQGERERIRVSARPDDGPANRGPRRCESVGKNRHLELVA